MRFVSPAGIVVVMTKSLPTILAAKVAPAAPTRAEESNVAAVAPRPATSISVKTSPSAAPAARPVASVRTIVDDAIRERSPFKM